MFASGEGAYSVAFCYPANLESYLPPFATLSWIKTEPSLQTISSTSYESSRTRNHFISVAFHLINMIRSTTLWKATHSVFKFASYALIGSAYESSSYHFGLLLVVARHYSSNLYTNFPSYPPLAFLLLYSAPIPQTCLLSYTCSTLRLWRWTKEVSASVFHSFGGLYLVSSGSSHVYAWLRLFNGFRLLQQCAMWMRTTASRSWGGQLKCSRW